jgi:programmed cell death 6-interacting protein
MTMFEEGRELLLAEEEEDDRMRKRFGTERWTRPESCDEPNQGAKLWTQAAEAESWFANSASSDEVVREKFNGIQSTLAILAGPDRGIMDFVPSSRRTEIPETLKPAIGRLRSAYNEVTRLESRRGRKAEALLEKARGDDIKSDILAEAARLERNQTVATAIVPAHFEDFFDKRLDLLYEPDLAMVQKEGADQEKLLSDLIRANREFESQKKMAGDKGNREREQALQKLENAYYKYKELTSNVEVGRKFYNDLSRIVGNFRDSARTFVTERRREARMLEDEFNMPPLNSLSLSQENHAQQPASTSSWSGTSNYQYPPQSQVRSENAYFGSQPAAPTPPRQQVHSPAEAHIQSWASAGETVAPQPQPPRANPMQTIWNQDLPIKFSAPGRSSGANPAPPPANKPPPGTWDPNNGIRFG